MRSLSLAAGTIVDVDPVAAVDVAAESGFDMVGLWFDADHWTDATTSAVADRVAATGIRPLDLEPVLLGDDDHGDRMLEVAGELAVPFVLVASGTASHEAVTVRLAALAERARSVAADTTLVLEFLPIFSVATLTDAAAIVASIDAPNLGVLVDTLHLDRSGSTLTDAGGVRLPYLQLADVPGERPVSFGDLVHEALHGRLLPGQGELPLGEVLAALPDVPVSVELRSQALLDRHPDPVERALVVLAASRSVVDAADR